MWYQFHCSNTGGTAFNTWTIRLDYSLVYYITRAAVLFIALYHCLLYILNTNSYTKDPSVYRFLPTAHKAYIEVWLFQNCLLAVGTAMHHARYFYRVLPRTFWGDNFEILFCLKLREIFCRTKIRDVDLVAGLRDLRLATTLTSTLKNNLICTNIYSQTTSLVVNNNINNKHWAHTKSMCEKVAWRIKKSLFYVHVASTLFQHFSIAYFVSVLNFFVLRVNFRWCRVPIKVLTKR